MSRFDLSSRQALNDYLDGIGAFDLLNAEGEVHLSRAIEEGRVVPHSAAKKRMKRWLS